MDWEHPVKVNKAWVTGGCLCRRRICHQDLTSSELGTLACSGSIILGYFGSRDRRGRAGAPLGLRPLRAC